ncbi:MAG: MGH1-like glycoside hydrolase domain-containing protein [Gammaproteobacteria bacterium]
MSETQLNAERQRLENQRTGRENWRLWGPYLAERAWGTVREDYSEHGTAWEYFDHDQARSRAYRWSEDGMGGICDEQQRLCLAFAVWNGRDPILKERAFGLTGNQGNHGEDVKECYFYVDATPSHSVLRYHYHYPQAEYPYQRLIEENTRRSRNEPPFGLIDSGAFADGRYWDVRVEYAKAAPDEIHIRVLAYNHGPDQATLHLLPQLWFRNTWSWNDSETAKPRLWQVESPEGAAFAIRAEHPDLGHYTLYGEQPAELLFTDNESNSERLWQIPNAQPYVKDAFHRYLIQGEKEAVNPGRTGTKCAAVYRLDVAPNGQAAQINLVLSGKGLAKPFGASQSVFSKRRKEADVFYAELLPEGSSEDHHILRQALAGMIWCKQFFHYDVARWIHGDQYPADPNRRYGRNSTWRHFQSSDVISMPDSWEYPWFAAWDLAFHCAALALIDVDFAKDQLELLLKEYYIHPNGQIPAYEWAFGDVNPPVHAMAVLKVFRAERVQRGVADIGFLQRIFHKLMLNYVWWINRKDKDGHNVFEGGFLGLDNISVFDRSHPLPEGFSLKQADATGWMAMFALNMTVIALEICVEDRDYEDMAIQCFQQFINIANALNGDVSVPLWDEDSGFFKDVVVEPNGAPHRIDVYSWVGLIPLFACEVVDQRLLVNVPRFRAMLRRHGMGLFHGNIVCACPESENQRGEHLLSLVDAPRLVRILQRLLDENEFLSRYGIRAVSARHASHRDLGFIPGIGHTTMEYVPGESNSGLFGGNSNWRGPIWMPCNFTLIQALEKFHRFLGSDFKVRVMAAGGAEMTLREIATLISERLVDLFRRDPQGRIPALSSASPFQNDPNWRELLLFHEYFHGDTGEGLGAAHQTGWTGLVANLIMRRYRKDIPAYWREQSESKRARAVGERV